MAQRYKGHKRSGGGRHVQLHEWLQSSEAWATLSPGPRALYIELKRQFTGSNNGRIFLSHRDAARLLSVHRNTVGKWFRELEKRGFIRLAVAPHLGPAGIGEASVWALTEMVTADGRTATKDFMKWRSEKQNPRTKSVPARHKKQDAKTETEEQRMIDGTEYVTPSAKKSETASQ